MIAHLGQVYPEEGCGLLGGYKDRVSRISPIENIEHSLTRYAMDPAAQIGAMLAFEAEGLEMVAIYHSHPHSAPYPSETDLAHAFYPEAVYLIVSLQLPDAPEMRAFRLIGDRFEEVSFKIIKNSFS